MPAPSTSLGTLRPELGTLYEFDLNNNRSGFIGYRVMPILNVKTAADKFGRIPTEQLGKLATVTRNSSGSYNRIHWTFTDDSYATKEYGLEGPVDNRNARLYDEYFKAEVATTQLVTHNVLANAEKRVADAVFNTTTFTSYTTSVSTEWSSASATPITDVMAASQLVRNRTGRYANALVICRKVRRNLVNVTQIIDRIAASGAGDKVKPADITDAQLAACFDVDYVIVADSSYDSTTEGQSTTFSDIWDDEYAMVCRVAQTDSIEEPCIGRTFHWTGDGSSPDGTVEVYESKEVRGEVVRVRHDVHEKVIYPECGQLLANITA